MSSGVEQIKPLGTIRKESEERTIPWSQQVDEASCENLTINSNDDSFVSADTLKFQYPPFKENQNHAGNLKYRKNSNFDISKKYGRSVYLNNKRDEHHSGWNGPNSRRSAENISGETRDRFIKTGSIEYGSIRSYLEKNVSETAPTVTLKKTTWALVASQPAKNPLKTTLLSSTQMKKGPGMPPPPMVPGKHDLEVNIWNVATNNPPPRLPSPPPIETFHSEVEITDLGDNALKIDNNKSVGQQKDNRSGMNRSRYPSNGQHRKSWSNPNFSNTTNRRNTSSGDGWVQRKVETVRKPSREYVEENLQDRSKQEAEIQETVNVNEKSFQTSQAVLNELRDKNNYNPSTLDMQTASTARFFVIKSYSEDDIHRSIKYEIWCSTDHGNKRLDDAFEERKREGGEVLLLFSVNGSGHFCGVAQMMTSVDYNSTSTVWSQDKWKGKFKVKWLYVKDVPNIELRHIKLENNENKAVTNSRDTQEVPNAKGIEVLQIIHSFENKTSIFDDFHHYEQKQVEEGSARRIATSNQCFTRGIALTGRAGPKAVEDRDTRGSSKHFSGNGSQSFREKNRIGLPNFYEQKLCNENNGRNAHKYEVKKEKDRLVNKQINRERVYVEDHFKNGYTFRKELRDNQKDNEFEDQR